MNVRRAFPRWSTLACFSLFALLGFGCTPTDAATCATPLDPAGVHFGRTYAEWNADWWRWLYETPNSRHPIHDATGEFCGENQPGGAVFYLAGTNGGAATRTCTIPAGKAIYFPVMTFAADNGGVPTPVADAELRAFVNSNMTQVTSLSAELDGCAIPNLTAYATGLGTFSYDCPAGDCIYAASGSDFSGHVEPAYSNGYSVLLAPLAPGAHELHFAAVGNSGTPDDTTDDFSTEATYHLTVE